MKILGGTSAAPIKLGFGVSVGLFATIAAFWLTPASADPAQAEGESKSAPKPPAIVKVEKGSFRIEVTVSGVFEAEHTAELSIRPKAWAMPLVVDRAIDLGTPVKKGDILVEFDRDKIDRAIQDADVEASLSELTLKHAEEELPLLEKALPVDLAAAEQAKTQADQDLKKFLEIDRSQSERSAQFLVKRSVEYLEYAKEELRQLEKMYRSKDLTEETEEIILRRTRFQVESNEFNLKEAELQRNRSLKIDLPRQEVRLRESAVKQSIDLEKARALLPLGLNQKRRALAKLKYDQAKSAEKLADLRHDRDAMTVHAPTDGLVYYGRCERGQWSAAATGQKLRRGGVIASDEVFITVVTPRPVDIRATVEEKDLHVLTQPRQLRGIVTPAFDPELRLSGLLVSILPVPRESAKFEAVIRVDLKEDPGAIKPGMACAIKFVPYRKEYALTVPRSAIFDDDSAEPFAQYVYFAKRDSSGKNPKRPVKTGKTANGRTEILDGLAEGDEVLSGKP
jgi:multidrug resistance efflux pump